MNKRTLKALKGSREHWYRISACMTPKELNDEGFLGDDCDLCALFLDPMTAQCNGCPVYEASGKHCCVGTPYHRAQKSLLDFSNGYRKWTEEDQQNIEDEIRFLESLLPE